MDFVVGGPRSSRGLGGGWRDGSAVPESIPAEVRLTWTVEVVFFRWKPLNMAEFGTFWNNLIAHIPHIPRFFRIINYLPHERKMVDLVWSWRIVIFKHKWQELLSFPAMFGGS